MRYVCKNCFSDEELIGLIISQGNKADCDCCNSKNVEAIEFAELLDFFKDLFENFQVKEHSEGKNLIS